jgi:peptidoglycan/xylan/chitin deacetylase (PgdA/CDA1 family)
MILNYHKVDAAAPTMMWVTADTFRQQMLDIQTYNVVALDDYNIADPRHVAITFDDAYDGVVKYAAPVMHELGYPFELFVNSNWIGRENDFDRAVEPLARFASLTELDEAVALGGRIQWHTRSHLRLRGAATDALAHELEPPEDLRAHFGREHLRWFAYPYGAFDKAAVDAVRTRFVGALATEKGDDGDRYLLTRKVVYETTTLSRTAVSVIVAARGASHSLTETIDSLLRQSSAPSEILITDHTSSGAAASALTCFARDARISYAGERQSVEDCFRHGASVASGDYLVFLSAGDRLRADCIERCKSVLDRNRNTGAVFSDAMVSGENAAALASTLKGQQIAISRREREPLYYLPRNSAAPPDDAGMFAMYRRHSYKQAGPGRHDELLRRIETVGMDLVHIGKSLIEIRRQPPGASADAAGLEIENQLLRFLLADQEAQLTPRAQFLRFARFLAGPWRLLWFRVGAPARRRGGSILRKAGINPRRPFGFRPTQDH